MHHSHKTPATFKEVTEEAMAEAEVEVVGVLTEGQHQDLIVQQLFVIGSRVLMVVQTRTVVSTTHREHQTRIKLFTLNIDQFQCHLLTRIFNLL